MDSGAARDSDRWPFPPSFFLPLVALLFSVGLLVSDSSVFQGFSGVVISDRRLRIVLFMFTGRSKSGWNRGFGGVECDFGRFGGCGYMDILLMIVDILGVF